MYLKLVVILLTGRKKCNQISFPHLNRALIRAGIKETKHKLGERRA
jgi:hypothetical protein